MKILLFLFFCINLVFAFSQSQSEATYVLSNANASSVDQYSPDPDLEYLVLGSSFSRDSIRQLPFSDRRIVGIDLVYTAFSESEEFDQQALDLRRLEQLIELNPQIIDNKFFEWNYVEQTGCGSSSACLKFFHGFVVYYEKYFTKEDTQIEIDSVKKEMADLETQIQQFDSLIHYETVAVDCAYPELLYSLEHVSSEIDKFYSCTEKFTGKVFFTVSIDKRGRPIAASLRGKRFPCQKELIAILKHVLRWKRGFAINGQLYPLAAKGYVSYPIRNESLQITGFEVDENLENKFSLRNEETKCIGEVVDTSYVQLMPLIEKKVVSNVLIRNNWEDELWVVDVTASMYPYTADMLRWIRLSGLYEEKTFVFFNDGNDKPSNQKRIGRVGGIEQVRSTEVPEIERGMFAVMKKGGGGDLKENNIEALLFGLKYVENKESAIMIADNYAFPRDVGLLSQFQGKLRIILCGTEKGVNTDYLNLAKVHGFSLHTESSDVEDLSSIGMSQKVTIDQYEYLLTPSGFKRTRL